MSIEQRKKMIQDFKAFFNLDQCFLNTYHSTGTYSFYKPDKILGFTLGKEKIPVSKVVNNSRKLMEVLEEGRKEVLRTLPSRLKAFKEGANYTRESMGRACTVALEVTVHYFVDVLDVVTRCAELTKSDFEMLSDITARYIYQYEDAVESVYQSFGGKLEEISVSQERQRRQMDLITAQKIDAAPRYVHIKGKIRDGFFGPGFDGSVTVTHSMSHGQIRQAYDENRAAAWAMGRREERHAKLSGVEQLENIATNAVFAYFGEVHEALSKCNTKTIHKSAFISSSYTARPYLPQNVLVILSKLGDSEKDFGHIGALVNEYKIDYEKYMLKPCAQQALETFLETGSVEYDSKILRCCFYMTETEKVSQWQVTKDVFFAHYEEKLREKYKSLLTDASIRTKKMPPETGLELFREILDDAKKVPSDILGGKERDLLEEKAKALFEKLKAERKEGLFGLKIKK